MAKPLSTPQALNTLRSTLGDPHLKFSIFGDPVGFVITNGKFSKKSRRVWDYMQGIQDEMKDLGIFDECVCSRDTHVFVITESYFRNGTHPDPENVHKLVKDAMFYKKPLGDKYTGGFYLSPVYDKENPRVEVMAWYVPALKNES